MRQKFLKIAAFVFMCSLSGFSALADTVIVVNCGPNRSADVTGHQEAKINWLDADTKDDTECTESFAALELQHYLQKMTGKYDDFDTYSPDKIVGQEDLILVGNPAISPAVKQFVEKLALDLTKLGVDPRQLAELGVEGYRISSTMVKNRRVTFVAGNTRVGTLYAAYDLLHRLGCRWTAPGEVNDEIPHLEKIADMDVTEKPSFELRRFHAWEERVEPSTNFFLWMARNRLNSWCISDEKPGLLRKLGIQMSCGAHDAEGMFVGPQLPYPYDYKLFEGDEKKPKDPYKPSDQFKGDTNKDGVLSYFEAHPEWYAFYEGKRIPGIRTGNSGRETTGYNYCSSNEDATKEFLKNYVRAVIDGVYKQGDVILFWTLDSGTTKEGLWCQCAECKALGTPTDRYLKLVYEFDKEIKKAQKTGTINRPIITRFMIYRDVIDPPTKPLPDDFDYKTCTGTFFPAVQCYMHHFDDPNCSINVGFLQQLDAWVRDPQRYYKGPVGVGEYYNIHRFRCLPVCFMHSMEHDISYFFHKCGVRQFDYMHVKTENWGNQSLTNYQMARQLWNVDTDCEAMWKDFFSKRYGPAAEKMRSFYEELEKVDIREIKSTLAGTLKKGDKDLFPTSHLRYNRTSKRQIEGTTWVENVEYIKNCRKLIDEARKIKVPERIESRIAEDEGMFVYAENTIEFYAELVETFNLARAEKRDEARKHYDQAVRIAEILRKDTKSVSYSWDHFKNPNALEASACEGTLEILKKLLSPAETADAK